MRLYLGIEVSETSRLGIGAAPFGPRSAEWISVSAEGAAGIASWRQDGLLLCYDVLRIQWDAPKADGNSLSCR